MKIHRIIFLVCVLFLALKPAIGNSTLTLTEGTEVLERAFSKLYGLDLVRVAKIRVSNRSGDALEYHIEMASKRIDGLLRSYGVFTHPPRLRNMAILAIEAVDRSDDYFIYMPASGRVRRISSAQHDEQFMGTDLTYEDFERRRVDDYRVEWVRESECQAESTLAIGAVPRYSTRVSRVEFEVAIADDALLETRYFKEQAKRPFRILHAPRSKFEMIGDRSLPTRYVVENIERRTKTVVNFEQLQPMHDLSDSLFSPGRLEIRRSIPGLNSDSQ